MPARKELAFQLGRVTGLLRLLFRSKMAIVGLFLLIGFSTVALAAPLLSPYRPNQPVSGSLSQPEWVMNFPDGHYLSKNIVLADDPAFKSPGALQAWTINASPATLSNLQISYSPNTSSLVDSTGSILMVYSGKGSANVSLSRTLHYPYHGPPDKLVAGFALLAVNGSAVNPVNVEVRLIIDRLGDQAFTMYNQTDRLSGQWVPPASVSLDSQSQTVKAAVGGLDSTFNPAEIIFSAIQDYSYTIQVTFNGAQTVYLDNLQLKLFGTAWGLMGTDNGGNDVYTLVIYGSRISLLVGLTAAGIGIGLGLVIGLMAGFLGRIVDETLMRFTDMMLVIPSLPLLIVLVAVLGQNIWNVIIIIGFLGWMGFARIVRSQVLTLKERPFVEAAKASGAGPMRIITRHIFPNIVSLTYVNLALSVPTAILSESALAFLGLSDPAVTSWGNIFSEVQRAGALSLKPPPWWWVLPPGFSIALVSLSFVLIGYALDELFNPKLRRRR